MSVSLNIPKEYGYVLSVASLSTVVAGWHSMNTVKFRKQSKVGYPNAYVTDAEAKESKDKYLFNCAQRAHANYLEKQPQVLVGLLIGGVRYPVISAALGAAWLVARIQFMYGYCRRDKEGGKGRVLGARTGFFFELGLLVLSAMTGYQVAMS